VTVADQLKTDLTAAMKAGEKDRVGALRMILSELQKDAKEGAADEVALLRRERKGRLDAATQFRDAGRDELAAQEEGEAELIAGYLPKELSDEEIDAIVASAVSETGASSPKDMGQVMKAAMATVAGRADGKRVSARVQGALSGSGSARSSSTTPSPRSSRARRMRCCARWRAISTATSSCAGTCSRSRARRRRSPPGSRSCASCRT
jgi:uncharacterized protein